MRFRFNDKTKPIFSNNYNNNHDDIYSAVIYGASHMRGSLWFIWAKVGQRQVAANL